MILSEYRLSRTDCHNLNIRDTYSIHKAVYTLFPPISGNGRDFIFVDKGGDFSIRKILVLSERIPEKPEFGEIESRDIPESFLSHERYGFEIVLNPTKRDAASRKIIPVRGFKNLYTWFLDKTSIWGFTVEENSLQVGRVGVTTFKKEGSTCTLGTATFTGRLLVVDRALFIKSFKHGIGRAKSFGFGLLQVIPLQN